MFLLICVYFQLKVLRVVNLKAQRNSQLTLNNCCSVNSCVCTVKSSSFVVNSVDNTMQIFIALGMMCAHITP